MHRILLIKRKRKRKKILEKEKYTSQTTACLMLFTCAFCHLGVKNLLKGPLILSPFIKNAILFQAKHLIIHIKKVNG